MLIHAGYPPRPVRPSAAIRNASVSSSACKFYRIGHVRPSSNGNSDFRLADGTPFAITADEGIVYVDDPQRLRTGNRSSYRLEIQYHNANGTQKLNLSVNVTSAEDPVECQASGSGLCAEFRTEGECIRHAGLAATAERGCWWRASNSSGSRLTSDYSTCSTDLATCPDEHCDDLETKDWSICPQDCTGSYILFLISYFISVLLSKFNSMSIFHGAITLILILILILIGRLNREVYQ